MTKKQKNLLIRVIVAAVFFVPLYLISEGIIPVELPTWAMLALFLVPYLTVGYDILRKAALGIKNRRVFDECFLMTVATIGAIALGEFGEGVAVMLLYQVGELFQGVAVGRSRRNISELMDIRPDYANIEGEDGQLERVDPDEVETGSIIVVQPGEKVPIDGVIVEGATALNTSALTGESKPMDVSVDDTVLSGSINLSGLIKVRTTAEFEESTASKILDLVENAASRKYLTKDHLWYWPPGDAVEAMARYATMHGRPTKRPYFSIDGQTAVTADSWDALRAPWHHRNGITNVWSRPPLHDQERIKGTMRRAAPRTHKPTALSSAHLNQKPLDLTLRQVYAASNPNDIIWEPFGGLTTASVASILLGRTPYAAEIDKEFFELGQKRLQAAETYVAIHGIMEELTDGNTPSL